jgi:hypothetical protein
MKAKAPKGLKKGYAVSYTGSDGERHVTRKVWRKKATAETWAERSPPSWRAHPIRVRRR